MQSYSKLLRSLQCGPRSRDILYRKPDGLEEGDLIVGGAPLDSTTHEVAELTMNVIRGDRIVGDGLQNVAGLLKRGLALVDD